MKIKYEFVTGEIAEIEVDEKWGNVVKELDRVEYNNNHTETRRHASLSHGNDGEWLIANEDEEGICVDNVDANKVISIADAYLTDKQKAVFLAIAYLGYSFSEYGKECGISKQSVHEQFKLAVKNIRKHI